MTRLGRTSLLAALLLAGVASDAPPAAVPLPAVGTKWKGRMTPAVGSPLATAGKVTASADKTLTLSLGGQIGMTADWTLRADGKNFVLADVTVTRGDVRLSGVAGTARVAADEIDINFTWRQTKGRVANLPVSGQVVLRPDPPARGKDSK